VISEVIGLVLEFYAIRFQFGDVVGGGTAETAGRRRSLA